MLQHDNKTVLFLPSPTAHQGAGDEKLWQEASSWAKVDYVLYRRRAERSASISAMKSLLLGANASTLSVSNC
jgi:hypothetical protein